MNATQALAAAITLAALAGCAAPQRSIYIPPAPQRELSIAEQMKPYTDKKAAESILSAQSVARVGAARLKSMGEKKLIEAAKANVAGMMKDPGSVQLRAVRIVNYAEGKLVCGEVNAKNSYGGYIGFKPFMSVGTTSEVYEGPGKYDYLQAGLLDACGR